jgi:hypothetical protein
MSERMKALIARRGDDWRRTTYALKEVTELRVDMLVAAVDEEFDVLNYFQDRAAGTQRLRRNARPVAVVNAVMPPLNKILESTVHPLVGVFASRRFVRLA